MITTKNYTEKIKGVKLDDKFKDAHKFTVDFLEFYNDDEVIKKTIDLYLEKLNSFIGSEISTKKKPVENVAFKTKSAPVQGAPKAAKYNQKDYVSYRNSRFQVASVERKSGKWVYDIAGKSGLIYDVSEYELNKVPAPKVKDKPVSVRKTIAPAKKAEPKVNGIEKGLVGAPTGMTKAKSGGRVGSKYEQARDWDIKQIAKAVKAELQKRWPTVKWSVKSERFSGGSAIRIETSSYPINPYSGTFTQFINEGITPRNADERVGGRSGRFNQTYIDFEKAVNAIPDQYRYDNSDPMTDYFSTNFYATVSIDLRNWEEKVKAGNLPALVEVKPKFKTSVVELEYEIEQAKKKVHHGQYTVVTVSELGYGFHFEPKGSVEVGDIITREDGTIQRVEAIVSEEFDPKYAEYIGGGNYIQVKKKPASSKPIDTLVTFAGGAHVISDRNREENGDYKTIAHVSVKDGIKWYFPMAEKDPEVQKEAKALLAKLKAEDKVVWETEVTDQLSKIVGCSYGDATGMMMAAPKVLEEQWNSGATPRYAAQMIDVATNAEPQKPKLDFAAVSKLASQYLDNEKRNDHTSNILLLAKAFGSPYEIERAQYLVDELTMNRSRLPDHNDLYTEMESKASKWHKTLNALAEKQIAKLNPPMQPYSGIYKNLLKIFPDLDKVTESDVYDGKIYVKKTIEGYDKFSAEISMVHSNGRLVLDMSHTFVQEGDLMSAPRMQVSVDNEMKIAEAINYEAHNTIPQVYKEVYDGNGGVNITEKKSQNKFLKDWTRNLINQGFTGLYLLEPDTAKQEAELAAKDLADEMDGSTTEHEVAAQLELLAKMANEAKAKGKDAPDYNLCDISVPGTNIFCTGNKGVERKDMPQLKGRVIKGSEAEKLAEKQADPDYKGEVDAEEAFKEHLKKKGVAMVSKTVPAENLKSTQSELVGTKVAGMTEALKADPNNKGITAPIFISKDGYVLDGHHRWAAHVGLGFNTGEPVKMKVIEVGMNINQLLKETNDFTDKFGIAQNAGSVNEEFGSGNTKGIWSIQESGNEWLVKKDNYLIAKATDKDNAEMLLKALGGSVAPEPKPDPKHKPYNADYLSVVETDEEDSNFWTVYEGADGTMYSENDGNLYELDGDGTPQEDTEITQWKIVDSFAPAKNKDGYDFWSESSFDSEDKEKEYPESLIVAVSMGEDGTQSIATMDMKQKKTVDELIAFINEETVGEYWEDGYTFWSESSFDSEDKEKEYPESLVIVVNRGDETQTIGTMDMKQKKTVDELIESINELTEHLQAVPAKKSASTFLAETGNNTSRAIEAMDVATEIEELEARDKQNFLNANEIKRLSDLKAYHSKLFSEQNKRLFPDNAGLKSAESFIDDLSPLDLWKTTKGYETPFEGADSRLYRKFEIARGENTRPVSDWGITEQFRETAKGYEIVVSVDNLDAANAYSKLYKELYPANKPKSLMPPDLQKLIDANPNVVVVNADVKPDKTKRLRLAQAKAKALKLKYKF